MTARKRVAPTLPMLRTSERKDFRRCPQRWWWGWRMGLTKRWAPNALWFGEGVHLALAEWYKKGTKRGPEPEETFTEWVGGEKRRVWTNPSADSDHTEIVDALELGVTMLNGYRHKYGSDSGLKFIETEHPFQIRIPSGTSGSVEVLYCGTFDGVFRDEDGLLWLIEHKTAKAITIDHLPLDDQAGSYWLVAEQVLKAQGLIKPDEHLQGILYNFLRKTMPDQREKNAAGLYLNKDHSVSKSQPAPYFHREPVYRFPREHQSQLLRIQAETAAMNRMKTGEQEVYKNPTRDCAYDCQFFFMCQLHEAGDDWEEYAEAEFVVQDPYADHRKSTQE